MGTKVDKKSSDSVKVKKSGSKVAKITVSDDSLKVKKSSSKEKVAKIKVTEVDSAVKPDEVKSEKKKEKVKTTAEAAPKSATKKSKLPMGLTVSGVGKVDWFNDSAKFGFILSTDAKFGDERIYFRDKTVLYLPGLEVQFDATQTEKGPRAENVKILDTPENKEIKANDKKDKVVEKKVMGLVTFVHKLGTFGFIKRDKHIIKSTMKKGKDKQHEEKLYFCINTEKFKPGMEVKFDVAQTEKGPRAVNVKVYRPQDDTDSEDDGDIENDVDNQTGDEDKKDVDNKKVDGNEDEDGSEDGEDMENDVDSEDGDENEDGDAIEGGEDSEGGDEMEEGDENENDVDSEDGEDSEGGEDSEDGEDIGDGVQIEDGEDSDESDEPEPPKKKKKTKK